MSDHINISAAGNTEVPSYLCLIKKGFIVKVEGGTQEEQVWYAIKDNIHLTGSGPMELLALSNMLELRGVNWPASDAEIETFTNDFC